MSMICLILKCFRKKGMVRINSVLDICEMDSRIIECLILKEFVNLGILVKFFKNVLLYVFVICKVVFSNIEKKKKIVIFFFLNRLRVFRLKEDNRVLF